MATPTISEYTAHLRVDKAGMREQLLNANIETAESDTFTDLSKKILEKSNAIRRIYVQPDEPLVKQGLWFKRYKVEEFDVVSDPMPLVEGTFTQGVGVSNPDSSYEKVKDTYFKAANNNLYYICVDCFADYNPNEILRIYKYNSLDSTWTRIQTYTSAELVSVRGESSGSYTHSFRSNANLIIDDDENYLYIVGGNYSSTTAESNKYITRFGLKTHIYERVHTKLSNWFSISSPGSYDGAQIVGNKIYVFGHSTQAGAYGPTYNTKIIDLDTGTETNLNTGPIAYSGTTVKVNSHLIAGFGGGSSSYNSGLGMTHVCLFDTNTNTATLICYLTNKNNQRVLAAVGNRIYFAEYNSSKVVANSVGFVNLTDNSVTYIDDVFTPTLESLAVGRPIYFPESDALLLGRPVYSYALYQLESKPYNKDTVVLYQSPSNVAQYTVDLFTTNGFATDVNFSISDAWFYKAGAGLETTGEVYYGDGTEWLPLVHGNTAGGVSPLKLQRKVVEFASTGTEYLTPDVGYDGLSYAEISFNSDNLVNVFVQEEEPETKEGIWLQTTPKEYTDIVIDQKAFVAGKWYTNNEFGVMPRAYNDIGFAKVGDYFYFLFDRTYNTGYKYNVKESTFESISDSPVKASDGCIVVCDTDIYIFSSVWAYKYNTLTDTYTQVSSLPYQIAEMTGSTFGTDIYLFGGYTGTSTANQRVYKYDTLTDTYTQLGDFPNKYTNYMACITVGANIYLLGGYHPSLWKLMTQIYKYDPITDTYEVIVDSCKYLNKYGGQVFSIGTDIYYFNGDTGQYFKVDITTGEYTLLGTTTRYYREQAVFYANNKIFRMTGPGDTNIDVLTLDGSTYNNNSIVLIQNENMNSYIGTELLTLPSTVGRLRYKLNDVFYYSTESGLDDTIPTYYGDGTQWVKLKN